jgi:hypothetical protein
MLFDDDFSDKESLSERCSKGESINISINNWFANFSGLFSASLVLGLSAHLVC